MEPRLFSGRVSVIHVAVSLLASVAIGVRDSVAPIKSASAPAGTPLPEDEMQNWLRALSVGDPGGVDLLDPLQEIPGDTLRDIWSGSGSCADFWREDRRSGYGAGICLCGTGVNYGREKISELRREYGVNGKIWDDLMFNNVVRLGMAYQLESGPENFINFGVWGISQGSWEAAVHLAGMSAEDCFRLGKEMRQHSVIWRDCSGGPAPVVFMYTSVDRAIPEQHVGWFKRKRGDCKEKETPEAHEEGNEDFTDRISDAAGDPKKLIQCDVSACDGSLSFERAVQEKCIVRMSPMKKVIRGGGRYSGSCFLDYHVAKEKTVRVLEMERKLNPDGIHGMEDYLKRVGPRATDAPYTVWRVSQFTRAPLSCAADGHLADYVRPWVDSDRSRILKERVLRRLSAPGRMQRARKAARLILHLIKQNPTPTSANTSEP